MTPKIRQTSLSLTAIVVSITLLSACGAGSGGNEISSETPVIGPAIDADDNQPTAPLPVAESSDRPETSESPSSPDDSVPVPLPEEPAPAPTTDESASIPGAFIPVNVECSASVADIQSSTLNLINAARATARSCGDIFFEATEPVTWNTKLADAARAHSDDMALHNFFSHTGSDGSNVSIRVDSQAYDWRAVGENLAAGQRTTEEAVEGWIESPSHCKNLMNSNFEEVAIVCVENSESDYGSYWTKVLGTSF